MARQGRGAQALAAAAIGSTHPISASLLVIGLLLVIGPMILRRHRRKNETATAST